jgi:glycosyltransferase involved in cell wall biosynthesis
MQRDSDFAIIIPTYNHALYLKIALQSVVAQTFENWTAIVINNHSTDETIQVVESFKDKRIVLLNFSNNGIIAKSRNVGAASSQSKYLCFLDSDDYWFPEKLKTVWDELEQGADLVCHSEIWQSEGREDKLVHYGPQKAAEYRSLLLHRNCISTSAVAMKRSCFDKVGGFSENPKFSRVEDYDLWLRVAMHRHKFVFIRTPLGIYRIHPKNSSNAVFTQMKAEFEVLISHMAKQQKISIVNCLSLPIRLSRVVISHGIRALLR